MCAYEMIAHVCIQYLTLACVYAVLPIYYEYALVQATYTHKLVMAVAHKRLPPRSILSVMRRDMGPKHRSQPLHLEPDTCTLTLTVSCRHKSTIR